MSVHIFGIRHHGPGSARSLKAVLERLEPDVVLVEGPPDAEAVLPLCTHESMKPPVALLVYVPGDPRKAVFYPMAAFSPEWHAIRFGFERGLPVRFMDLPQACRLAEESGEATTREPQPEGSTHRTDPLTHLALAAGFEDGERWWERLVEERRDAAGVFDAVLEAMTALRRDLALDLDPTEVRREAHMRHRIREAESEGFLRIAVVCGAWHAPVLREMPDAKADMELLEGLPRIAVAATWVPWTHARLSTSSGYGAGVESPGWYHHLWTEPADREVRWLARVARLLREKDLDASSAHVIEAVRLAECLAALRGRPLAGLGELNDAAEAVLCHGSVLPLRLVHDQLIVGQTLGTVPAETPHVPLQRDLEQTQKRLRLPARAEEKVHDFDLRKETDLARSRLLHRLCILGVDWGEEQRLPGKKGTFHEVWKLRWEPELVVRLIEASAWGRSVEEAAAARAIDEARRAGELADLARLLDRVLLADLSSSVNAIVRRIDDLSALSASTPRLMDALPPLGNALRYGTVRQTSVDLIAPIVDGLVARISVGLPTACASLDDKAAGEMLSSLMGTHKTIRLLEQPEHLRLWLEALEKLMHQSGLHGRIAGRAVRLLFDAGALSADGAARNMRLRMSPAVQPSEVAAWIEGFLSGSGIALLHDTALWEIVDDWVVNLSAGDFVETLPLLRRTFATFAAPERRQIGEHVRRSRGEPRPGRRGAEPRRFDAERAAQALSLVAKLLGLSPDPGRPGDG